MQAYFLTYLFWAFLWAGPGKQRNSRNAAVPNAMPMRSELENPSPGAIWKSKSKKAKASLPIKLCLRTIGAVSGPGTERNSSKATTIALWEIYNSIIMPI